MLGWKIPFRLLFDACAYYPPVAQTRFAQTVGLVVEAKPASHNAVLTSIFNLNMGFTLSVYEISRKILP